LARGRTVRVKVKVNRAGRVTIAGRARSGRLSRTVAAASATARSAGTVSLRLKLSRTVVKQLNRERQLQVTFTVQLAGERAARKSTVTIRAVKRATSSATVPSSAKAR
jgi:hypothetical protein